MLEFGEHLLDGVEVWAIGGQEQQACALVADGGADGIALVTAEVVHDDDIAGLERGGEELFDIALEAFAIDRSVEHARCIDAVMAQSGKEGHRLPMAVRHAGGEPLAPHAPAAQRRHVGLGPRLVDEHQVPGVKPALVELPAGTAPGNVRALLFACLDGLFL